VLLSILIAVAFFLFYILTTKSKPKHFPPGPEGIPFLGYWPFLGQKSHVKLMELGKKYGGLYSVKIGNKYAVVINDWQAMKDTVVRKAEVFSGRPDTFIFKDVRGGTDIASCYGPVWKEKRDFTWQTLRSFGFAKTSMEGLIKEEIVKLLDHLKARSNAKIQANDIVFLSFFNIIWTIAGSKRMESDDKKYFELKEAVHIVLRYASNTSILQFMPFMKHFPTIKSRLQSFYKHNKIITSFIEDMIDDHIKTFKEESPRDFIDVYLAEIYKKQTAGEKSITFQRSHLAGVLYNLNNGGIDTGSETMTWSLMYMATWPEIQEKVQEEIDRVVGRDRLPEYSDRLLMPYTEAVLMEVQRYASILCLSFPHACTKNIKIGEYVLPKGTFILQNLYAIHYDPNYWGDPEVFRPERFLNDQGQAQQPEYLIPFSAGKRLCLGDTVARTQMFLFFSCILHQFSFSYVTGEKPPSLEPSVGLILEPKDCSLYMKSR